MAKAWTPAADEDDVDVVEANAHAGKADQTGGAERSGGEVEHWMGALIRYVRSGQPDLTNRQMALMMLVHCREGPHTVRGLAEQLNVSKPVVTRALNKLGMMEFVRRERDSADRRNIFVRRTEKGAEFLDAFADFVAVATHDDKSKRGQGMRAAG